MQRSVTIEESQQKPLSQMGKTLPRLAIPLGDPEPRLRRELEDLARGISCRASLGLPERLEAAIRRDRQRPAGIAETTVKAHVTAIMRKLGLRGATDMTRMAMKLNLVAH